MYLVLKILISMWIQKQQHFHLCPSDEHSNIYMQNGRKCFQGPVVTYLMDAS